MRLSGIISNYTMSPNTKNAAGAGAGWSVGNYAEPEYSLYVEK